MKSGNKIICYKEEYEVEFKSAAAFSSMSAVEEVKVVLYIYSCKLLNEITISFGN